MKDEIFEKWINSFDSAEANLAIVRSMFFRALKLAFLAGYETKEREISKKESEIPF